MIHLMFTVFTTRKMLFVADYGEGADSSGAEGRNEAGHECHKNKEGGYGDEGQVVAGAYAVDHARYQSLSAKDAARPMAMPMAVGLIAWAMTNWRTSLLVAPKAMRRRMSFIPRFTE
jgi:hypothetical protein